jgi:hypothetical protein
MYMIDKMGFLITRHFFLFLMVFLISSCDDIFEKDITDKELVLIAPGDNLKTDVATQTFWWEELDGALTYDLQIVSPSFASIEIVIADTVISNNKFTINLDPGIFEWRVKAQNSVYESPFVLRTLEIDSTLDLKNQIVTLTSPADDAFLNSTSTLFKWKKLYNADTYSIEVHNTSWSGDITYSLSSITYDTLTIEDLADGVYYWGIKAWNSNSATDFSTREFTIDQTTPGVPSLLTPVDEASLEDLTVEFTWSRASDTGSTLTDSLLISTDSLFASGNVKAKFIQATEYEYAVPDTGTYFWKVKSVDAALNQGEFSSIRKFSVLYTK